MRRFRIFPQIIFFGAWICFANVNDALSATAPDPALEGGFAVASAEYRLPAGIDREVLADAQTELWARVFWPRDLSSARPVIFFLHGNHSTCGTDADPRVDDDCTYTSTGQCPAGYVVVPNHEGYDYVARRLATFGYVVISINANRGITCGDGVEGDQGLNLARGRLVLRHLESWYKWTSQGGAPASLGLGERGFLGAVDFANVGLVGHSRGGEGVRAAYNLYRDEHSPWPARIPNLDIRGIFEIGAVDGQTSRVLNAEDTAWNQLLPMCDGDVEDLQGRLPFERMLAEPSEKRPTPKSLYLAWGTNHNFYNSEWRTSDSSGCEGHKAIFGAGPVSLEQQKIASVAITSFFLAHVGTPTHAEFAAHFDPLFSLPNWLNKITRIDRDFIPTSDAAFDARLEDFDQPTGTSSRGFANESSGITISNAAESPPYTNLSWNRRASAASGFLQLNAAAPGGGWPANDFTDLNFRVSRQMSHLGSKEATRFHLRLVDQNNGLSAAVDVGAYASLLGPANAALVFQTVRIPLAAFHLRAGALMRGVRMIFDGSRKADLFLANVRLTASAPARSFAHDIPLIERNGPEWTSTASRTPEVRSAWVVHHKSSSRWLQRPTIDVTLQTDARGFPVSEQLPTLISSGQRFRLSRFTSHGSTRQLTFTIPRQSLDDLPKDAPVALEIGALHRWELPAGALDSLSISQ